VRLTEKVLRAELRQELGEFISISRAHRSLNVTQRLTISTNAVYWRRSRSRCLPMQQIRLQKQGDHNNDSRILSTVTTCEALLPSMYAIFLVNVTVLLTVRLQPANPCYILLYNRLPWNFYPILMVSSSERKFHMDNVRWRNAAYAPRYSKTALEKMIRDTYPRSVGPFQSSPETTPEQAS